jgi:hypothetical protein
MCKTSSADLVSLACEHIPAEKTFFAATVIYSCLNYAASA